MRRRLVIIAVVSALALAACGSSDDADVGSNDPATSSTNPAGTIQNVGPQGDQGGPANTAVSGGTTPSTTARAGTPTTAGSAGAAPQTRSGPYEPTPPGTYTFHTSGKASSPGFGERPIEEDDTQRVDPPTGTDQRNSRQSSSGNTEQVLRFGNDGIRLVSQKITNQQVTKEFRPNPPVLVLPYPLKKGQEWSWRMTSTDGATTVDGKFKYDRDEDLTIGGEKVATYVILATITTSGDITSTSKETLWVSPALRLEVKEHSVTDGRFGQVTFHSEATRTLKSTKPS